jgi:SAM-dependent methyltransferase
MGRGKGPQFVSHCDLCAEQTSKTHVYTKVGYRILRCDRCGLVSTDYSNQDTDLAAIYDEGYFEGGQTDGYADYGSAESVFRKQFFHRVKEIQNHQDSGRLLDIGCAYGFFLEEAGRVFKSTGVDLSAHGVQEAQKRGLDARLGTIDKMGFESESFDVVTLWDTIEHLPSPRTVLEGVFELLKPGGLLVVSTGDVDSILSKLTRSHWRLLTPPQHTFYFSKRTLRSLSESVGFATRKLAYEWRYIPLGLGLYQLTSRVLHRPMPTLGMSLGVYVNLFDVMTLWAVKPYPRRDGPSRPAGANQQAGDPVEEKTWGYPGKTRGGKATGPTLGRA